MVSSVLFGTGIEVSRCHFMKGLDVSQTAFCSVCFPKLGGLLPRFYLSLQMTSSLQTLTTVTRHFNMVIVVLGKEKKLMYSPPYFPECSSLLNV